MTRILLEPLEWFYPTAKAMFMWRKGRELASYRKGPVLVLQMGKVGSKSIQAGLEKLSLDRPIYHAHFLSAARTAETERERRKFFRTDRQSYLERPWLNQFLLRAYRDRKANGRWKVVTLTREPVGRNISAFFENLHVKPQAEAGRFIISSDYYRIEPTEVSVDDVGPLRELFYERATHDSPVRFFDREIRDIFGIDVLQTGFAAQAGYQIYSGDQADLLVIRLESLGECVGRAFSEFLGADDFTVINRNVGAKKEYAPLYDAFKRKASVTASYADSLYTSEYMRTFYTGDEIAAFRSRWVRDVDETAA